MRSLFAAGGPESILTRKCNAYFKVYSIMCCDIMENIWYHFPTYISAKLNLKSTVTIWVSKVILSQSAAVKYLFYRELYPLPRDTPVNWLSINQLEKKPIDLVYTWVNGSEVKYILERKRQQMQERWRYFEALNNFIRTC